ncbi:Gfo/Idh/MocA family oxidoreductase [Niabella sp.]|uniref:Gfo/Idh/MocA family protein n=1 Tax=Niabella sp. TaxID=1962976 RepID=UPI002612C830|nr:Gfo/Idh/MocA family oxidoreductase [Niabella sp.]
MDQKIRFAVVGYGHMGKRHVSVIQEHPDCKLAAVIDMHQQPMLPGIPFYNDLDDFLESSAVTETDVVVIATPNGLHAQHALKCLDAQKHVLIEKPMALSKADADAIIAKAKEVQRQVFVMMQNRFSPVSSWLKELTQSGVLGKIFLVQVNCFWNRDQRYYKKESWHGTRELDGGTLFTQFSHFIDLIYWCFGDISNIHSSFRNFNHNGVIDFEDTGIVHFDFVKGGMGSLSYTTAVWDKNLESSITVIAENGSVKVAGQYMDKVEYCHIKDYALPRLEDRMHQKAGQRTNPGTANHDLILENILRALKSVDGSVVSGNDGWKVVDMIQNIYKN